MSSESKTIINAQTAVSISLVLTCLSAVLAFGILWQKVESLRDDVKEVKTNVASLNDKVDRLLVPRVSYDVRPTP